MARYRQRKSSRAGVFLPGAVEVISGGWGREWDTLLHAERDGAMVT